MSVHYGTTLGGRREGGICGLVPEIAEDDCRGEGRSVGGRREQGDFFLTDEKEAALSAV